MRVLGVYLGTVWNGVNTVAGLLFVLAGGATFERIDPRWGAMLWVAKPGRWLSRFMTGGGLFGLVKGGAAAITVGEVIVVAAPGYLVNSRLLAHENRHVWQGFLLGPFHAFVYVGGCLVAWARGGQPYRDCFLEVDARRYAAEEVP
jgi:hypothetical protein